MNAIYSSWAFKCKRYPDGLIKNSKIDLLQKAIGSWSEL